jgi:hypothetical protein
VNNLTKQFSVKCADHVPNTSPSGAIPPRQIGWSNESELLWEIARELNRTIAVAGKCGNPYMYSLKTFSTYDTPGYPVGVWNVDGTYIGIAADADAYAALWNSDPANSAVATITAMSPTSTFFVCDSNVDPGLIGLRYWQIDTTRRASIIVGENSLVYQGTGQPVASSTLGFVRNAGRQGSFGNRVEFMVQAQNLIPYRQINIDFVTPGAYTVTVFHSETDTAAGFNGFSFFQGTGDGEISNIRGTLAIETLAFEALTANAFTSNNTNPKVGITNWGDVVGLKLIGINWSGDNTNYIANKVPSLTPWKNTLVAIGIGGNNGGTGPTELGIDSTFTNLDFLIFEYNTTATPFFTGNNFPIFRTGFFFRYSNTGLTAAMMDTFFNNIVANSGYSTVNPSPSNFWGVPYIRIGSLFTAASITARTTLATRGYVFI